MTTVTVVIAVKDGAEHIGRSLRSARAQTLGDIEIIVVDDASTDGTAAVALAASEGDTRVTVMSLPRNLGPSGARNAAIARARGRWVAILDADDAWLPERAATLVGAAEEAGVDMVCDDLLLWDAERDVPTEPMLGDGMPARIGAAGFVLGNLPDPDNPRRGFGFLKPMLRVDFLRDKGIRYDETMRFAEDYALYLDCLLAGAKWLAVAEPLYAYSLRGDSLTASHGAQDLALLCRIDERALNHPAAKADRALSQALRRHLLTVRKRERWALFIDQFRERRLSELPGTAAYSPRIFAHIAACCLREATLRSGRMAMRLVGGSRG